MIKIGTIIPNRTDATSFYRGAGPLSHLRRNYNIEEVPLNGAFNWAQAIGLDLIFLQRPAKEEHLQVLEIAQRAGVPVWVDYDDHVFDVPTDNPAWTYYGSPKNRQVIQAILKKANAVTVSTEALRTLFLGMNQNTFVVPNAIDQHYICNIPEMPRKKTLLWRGTDTHVKDVMTYKEEILACLEKHKDWNVTFMGWFPWFLADSLGSRLTFHATSNVFEFFRILNNEAPAIVMVPLHESDFNKSKSCIAAIEATICGASTLAPAWSEWAIDGVSHYTSKEGFQTSLDQMMSTIDHDINGLQDDVNRAMKAIESSKVLDVTNKIRLQIIADLVRVSAASLDRFPSERKRYLYPIRCTSTHKS